MAVELSSVHMPNKGCVTLQFRSRLRQIVLEIMKVNIWVSRVVITECKCLKMWQITVVRLCNWCSATLLDKDGMGNQNEEYPAGQLHPHWNHQCQVLRDETMRGWDFPRSWSHQGPVPWWDTDSHTKHYSKYTTTLQNTQTLIKSIHSTIRSGLNYIQKQQKFEAFCIQWRLIINLKILFNSSPTISQDDWQLWANTISASPPETASAGTELIFLVEKRRVLFTKP